MTLSSVLARLVESEDPKLTTPKPFADPTVADEMRSFRSELTLLKSRGIKITPSNSITIAYSIPTEGEIDIDSEFLKDLIRSIRNSNTNVGMYFESTPLTLAQSNRMLLEASDELRPDVQLAFITPYELCLDIKDDKLVIEIKNWLNPEEKATVYKKEVEYTKETKAAVLTETLQAITVLSGNTLATEERIDKIPIDQGMHSKWKPSVSLYRDKSLTEQQKSDTKNFFSKTVGNEISLGVLPAGKPVDQYINSDHLPISEATCVRNNFTPVLVNGICRAISFDMPMSNEIKPSAGKSFRDKFGNRITCSNSDEGIVSVTVEPRAFLSNETISNAPRGLSVDLTSLGLGVIENFIYQNEVPLITSLGSRNQYKIFSTCHDPEEIARIPKLAGGITAGTSTAERLFGFEPGTHAKNIIIMPSEEKNAHFSAGNPDTINVFFPQLTAGQSQVVGCHEAVHLISHRYGVSGGQWKEWFNNISKTEDGQTFLTLVCESFFSNIKDTGHAFENEDEFLASFVNGFRDTNWQKTVEKWPLGIQVLYKDSLSTLDGRLETLSQAYKNLNPPFNPVLLRTKIQERLRIVNKMIFGGDAAGKL